MGGCTAHFMDVFRVTIYHTILRKISKTKTTENDGTGGIFYFLLLRKLSVADASAN